MEENKHLASIVTQHRTILPSSLLYIVACLSLLVSSELRSQTLQWANRFGSSMDDQGFCVEVDNMGNIYLSGHYQGTVDFDPGPSVYNLTSVGGRDIFLAKFNPFGTLIWAKSIGSNTDDSGGSIVLDINNYIYLTGYFTGIADFDPSLNVQNLTAVGGQDIFIAKYDSMGIYCWARSIGGTGNEYGRYIILDGSNDIGLTGTLGSTADFDPGPGIMNLNTNGSSDIFFAKFDTTCNLIWAKGIGGTVQDFGYGIATDSLKNVYLTGYFQATTDFDPGPGVQNLIAVGSGDIFIAKYDSNGVYIWAGGMGGSLLDYGFKILAEPSGDFLITGAFENPIDFDPGPGVQNFVSFGGRDIFLAKYNASGNFLWVKQMGGPTDDQGFGLDKDAFGNIYISGYFSATADFDPGPGVQNLISAWAADVYFAKYNFQGDYIWAGGAGSNSADYGYHLVIDNQDNAIVTGFFSNTCDFDPGPGTQNLTSSGITDGFLAKYSSGITGEMKPFELNQILVYPNPTNGNCVVSTNNTEIMQIEIFSSIGRLIYNEKTTESNSVNIELSVSTGIYLFRITTTDGVISRLVEIY